MTPDAELASWANWRWGEDPALRGCHLNPLKNWRRQPMCIGIVVWELVAANLSQGCELTGLRLWVTIPVRTGHAAKIGLLNLDTQPWYALLWQPSLHCLVCLLRHACLFPPVHVVDKNKKRTCSMLGCIRIRINQCTCACRHLKPTGTWHVNLQLSCACFG